MKSMVEIGQSFNAHATEYEQAADIQFEIGQRLFERLDYLKIDPRFILDLGCGPGVFLKQLKKRYPKAQIVALDVAHAMLVAANAKQPWLKKWDLVNADMHQMPFVSGQFDLIVSNQVIHWANSLPDVIKEVNRIMRPGGCLLFSTLGPDTFQELKHAFKQVDTYEHVNEFYDMHHIGDCLVAELFEDPVVDMEILTAHYAKLPDLLRSLKAQGVKNIHQNRNPGLTGKYSWRKFEQSMALSMTDTQKYPLTYEVVYGHAWKSQRHRTPQGIEASFSVADLKASLKRI
ncbi:MAG: malonyl-[acyl-carrier protein] O-methyltransferase BioC [Legionella sp.]|nr:MAG: malonyl-[acyl-carrier protein] O-methyltransferase BioC [Legionella sp.]